MASNTPTPNFEPAVATAINTDTPETSTITSPTHEVSETAIPSNGPFFYPASGTIIMVYQEAYTSPTPGFHAGIDIEGQVGQPVFAVYDGILGRGGEESVNICHKIDQADFGNLAYLNVCTYYSHIELAETFAVMNKGCLVLAENGVQVSQGEVIGYISNSTNPPHLHFSVKKWDPNGRFCWESEPIYADFEDPNWLNMIEPLQYFGRDAIFYGTHASFP